MMSDYNNFYTRTCTLPMPSDGSKGQSPAAVLLFPAPNEQ